MVSLSTLESNLKLPLKWRKRLKKNIFFWNQISKRVYTYCLACFIKSKMPKMSMTMWNLIRPSILPCKVRGRYIQRFGLKAKTQLKWAPGQLVPFQILLINYCTALAESPDCSRASISSTTKWKCWIDYWGCCHHENSRVIQEE